MAIATAELHEFVRCILETQVVVRSGIEVLISNLAGAGEHLALSYLRASSPHDARSPRVAHNLVQAGPLCGVVEHAARPSDPVPGTLLSKFLLKEHGIFLSHSWIQTNPRPFGVWRIALLRSSNRALARDLRVCLVRLHTEKEVAALILRGVARGDIRPKPRSEESHRLQAYLRDTLRSLRELRRRQREIVGAEMAAVAVEVDWLAQRGQGDSIIRALERGISAIDFRPNIGRDLIKAAGSGLIYIAAENSEITLGHKVTIGRDGIVNIDSGLSHVTQSLGAQGVLEPQILKDLEVRIAALVAELEKIKQSNADEVKAITTRLKETVEHATRPPNERKNSLLDISVKGLIDAANTVAEIAPSLVVAAKSFVDFVIGLH